MELKPLSEMSSQAEKLIAAEQHLRNRKVKAAPTNCKLPLSSAAIPLHEQ
jgi:hypothetical protein